MSLFNTYIIVVIMYTVSTEKQKQRIFSILSLTRVSTVTRDVGIVILSVCLSVTFRYSIEMT